ncbi:MAG: glutamine-hydrolyzing GMP synthase [Candidatus Aenigmarchaeota archaeon]|nr:glutamine-hydrolyzing GMP synthase [Candidatus Aenigmarchaeota archaeon]
MKELILILDFGGQYTHLIARRMRELKVYSEIEDPAISTERLKEYGQKYNLRGLILSGGPSSVYSGNAVEYNKEVFNLTIPILGICYGHQLIAYVFGGKVSHAGKEEYGIGRLKVRRPVGIFQDVEPEETIWISHADIVEELPKDFEVLGETRNCPIAAFRHTAMPIYGVQFHPEVEHTRPGMKILGNFAYLICGCSPSLETGDFVEQAVREIREQARGSKAIVALSGGIDSSTAAVLASRALGKSLTAVFVDHGFMREGEGVTVKRTFEGLGLNVIAVNAEKVFLEKLKGVRDPEQKRKVVGEGFIRVLEDAAKSVGAEYLIQGTIYPDRIESGETKHSSVIKTHHNVGGIPSAVAFKGIIEPLKDLYKDEVRYVARELGLPESIVKRHVFPGPGAVVRIMGEITPEKQAIWRRVDRIVQEELEKEIFYYDLWMAFPVLLETRSTGVRGDARAFGYTVAIRAVESKDTMTANFSQLPYHFLERLSTRITNEVPEVTRVVYDITNKPPATMEWE